MVPKSDTNSTKDITRKGLSKKESEIITDLSEKHFKIITLADIQRESSATYGTSKSIASKLVRKNWLTRLKRGTYLINPLSAGKEPAYTEHEFMIASSLVSPYYIGYMSALNYYGFTEQTPFTIFIASTIRKGEIKIHGVPYRVIQMSEKKFFGMTTIAIENTKVHISTPAKTIADCLDKPQYAGGMPEITKALDSAKDRIDMGDVLAALIKMRSGAGIKRLYYLIDLLSIPINTKTRELLEMNITSGFSKLDPLASKEGTFSRKYRLILNIPEKQLIGDGET